MFLKHSPYGLIDLHLHLDGSLSPEWMIEWAEKQSVPLPATSANELKAFVSAPVDCSDLNEYLRCFELPLSLLQTPEALASAVADLIVRLDQLGLLYAEIRFAPQLHTQQAMTQEDAVLSALAGLEQGLAKTTLFRANLILCCMRADNNQAENRETIRLAHQYLVTDKAGVVAIDLAGAEGIYPTSLFADEFKQAATLQIPFTIHAGEAAGAESVQQALNFGAKRIGHGVRAIESETVMAQLIQQKTGVEMCPCSNLQTKAVTHLSSYPLRQYLNAGVLATLNTDNMTVSNTHIHQEFELLTNEYALSDKESKQLVMNAIQSAFLTEQDKQTLLRLVQQKGIL